MEETEATKEVLETSSREREGKHPSLMPVVVSKLLQVFPMSQWRPKDNILSLEKSLLRIQSVMKNKGEKVQEWFPNGLSNLSFINVNLSPRIPQGHGLGMFPV